MRDHFSIGLDWSTFAIGGVAVGGGKDSGSTSGRKSLPRSGDFSGSLDGGGCWPNVEG